MADEWSIPTDYYTPAQDGNPARITVTPNPLYDAAPVQAQQLPLPVDAPTFQQPEQPIAPPKPAYKLTPVDVDPFQSTGTEGNTAAESSGFKPIDRLFGLGGEPRYQTWPERMVREAVAAPHDVMNSPTPMTSEQMIPAAQAISSLAGVGSMPMATKGALGALGGKLIQPLKGNVNLSDLALSEHGMAIAKRVSEDSIIKPNQNIKLLPVEGNPFLDWNVKGFENQNWFHGTTHEFNKFDLNKGNIENHLGQYPHFTSSAEDAGANYAGKGPDLTSRIENLAEQKYLPDKMPAYNTPEYKAAYAEARAKATAELAGPHEGAIIPAKIKLNNPVSLVDDKPTWLDFNAKYDKEGEWVKDSPLTTKLLNSLKKQGEKYNFDGQKAFDEISEKASLYDGDVKASDLNKAMRETESMIYADNDNGNLVSSHVISNVFKDLGFDGIVMDAKSAFPNMKNIPEGTLHAVPLKKNTVVGKYSGSKLFSSGLMLSPIEHDPWKENK